MLLNVCAFRVHLQLSSLDSLAHLHYLQRVCVDVVIPGSDDTEISQTCESNEN